MFLKIQRVYLVNEYVLPERKRDRKTENERQIERLKMKDRENERKGMHQMPL